MINFIKAFSILAGTIIGVGIFGLPYVAAKSGFFVVFFYFLIMAFLAIFIHFLYGRVTLGDNKLRRFPGYVGEYLGAGWKKITFFTTNFGLMGALLAYLIVGGEFLKLYFSPYFGGSSVVYTLIFFSLGGVLVFFGIKSISKVELFFLFLFVFLLIVFFIKAAPAINLDYFKNIDWKFLTFPYGVVIFSLWGSALIPEVKEIVKGNGRTLNLVIISSIIFSAIVYLFFIITILGVSGPDTSKEALAGFSRTIGGGVIKLGFIFGFITTFTSFITLALTLKKTFWYDFGLSKNSSWFISCFTPLFLFFIGLREFITIIGFVGALMIGLEAIITVFLYRSFLAQKYSQKINPFFYSFVGIFVLGIIFEGFYLLLRST